MIIIVATIVISIVIIIVVVFIIIVIIIIIICSPVASRGPSSLLSGDTKQTPGVGALDDGDIRLSAGARRVETTPIAAAMAKVSPHVEGAWSSRAIPGAMGLNAAST